MLPVLVDQSIKGHPVPPTRGEIVYVDIGVPAEETHLNVRMMPPAGSGWYETRPSLTLLSSSDTRAAGRP